MAARTFWHYFHNMGFKIKHNLHVIMIFV